MKINTTTIIKTAEGEAYKSGEKDLTLGIAVGSILVVQKSPDPLKSYKFTNEFMKDEVDLTSEDMVFVKNLIKANAQSETPRFFPYILGQILNLLEPRPVGTK